MSFETNKKKSPLDFISTEKDAHLFSLDLWKWLSETGEENKRDYNYDLSRILSSCTLCEYYFRTTELRCKDCCLTGEDYCAAGLGWHFDGWYDQDNIDKRKFHAGKIYEQIKLKCEREGWI